MAIRNIIVGVLDVKFLIVLFFLLRNIPNTEVPESNNATTMNIKGIIINMTEHTKS